MGKRKYTVMGFGGLLMILLAGGLFTLGVIPDEVEQASPYELVVEKNPHHGHWRYEIHTAGRLMLRQEWIPGVKGLQYFRDEKEAERIGQLVLEKLLNGHPPSISRKELIENGISFK